MSFRIGIIMKANEVSVQSMAAVSIIIPIYNVESYLAECLDSVERQTFHDIEVILVNDGSTDNSGEIARSYVEKNENFFLIERKNGGLSAARNTGLAKATGEYIYFLDSDDYLVDDAIEKLYFAAKKDNLDLVKFSSYTFEGFSKDLNWNEIGGYKYAGDYPDVIRGMDTLQLLIDNGDTSIVSSCLIFIKRDIITKNNLRFFEGIIHEDNLFHWQLLLVCERVRILNEPLYCRRYREDSIMTSTPDYAKKNKASFVSIKTADSFLQEHPEYVAYSSNWFIVQWIRQIVVNWEKMSKEVQQSTDVKNSIAELKPIVYKYRSEIGCSGRIFYEFNWLYGVFRVLRNGVLKICSLIKR